MVKEYAQQLLHPTRGIDIPRPIPARTYKGHYSGQLLVESDTDSIMFQVKPDPFNFIEQYSNSRVSTDGVGNLPVIDLAFAGPDDVGNAKAPGLANLLFCYPGDAPLVDDTHVTNVTQAQATGTGILATTVPIGVVTGPDLRRNVVNGWTNVDIPNQTLNVTIANHGSSTITGTLVVYQCTGVGNLVPLAASGGPTSVSGQSQAVYTIAFPGVSASDVVTGFGFLLSNVATSTFHYEDLEFSPTQFLVNATVDHLAIRSYSIGQASYPNNPKLAGELDSLFSECNLYAPVACSTVINVTQVLKDQGGNFLAAYFPSRTSLPPDPNDAWITATTLGRSYPVATNHFAKGAHASWVGARIQDYEFRRPFMSEDWAKVNYSSLPTTYLIAQRAVSADASVARYYLDFSVCFSIQTFDPKITLSMSPSYPQFMALFLSLVTSNDLLVGENPDHLARLKQLAIQVATDPRVHDMLKFGLAKAIPLLMSALV